MESESREQANMQTTTSRISSNFSMYASSAFGAFVLCIGDLTSNKDAATVLKIQQILREYVFPNMAIGGVACILFIVGLGIISCWINMPRSRHDAFARGLSIFALLAVATPFNNEDTQQVLSKHSSVHFDIFSCGTAIAAANDGNVEVSDITVNWQHGNATIKTNRWVSSCKPSYSGLFGLGSFFNNTIAICRTGYSLKPGTRVRLLEYWDTELRKYRYVHVQYEYNNKILDGWIASGKGPNYWTEVVPDEIEPVYLEPIDSK